MLSFEPDPKILSQLKSLQEQVVEIYQEVQAATPEERAYLNHCALISNVGATTRIENAVLTDVEIEWVDTELSRDGRTTAFDEKKDYILDKLSKDRQRSLEEVAGSRAVLSVIYHQACEMTPLSETIIRGLHHELLQFYPPAQRYAGVYKTVINKVISRNKATGEERTVLEPTDPGVMTETAMHELVTWYNGTIREQPWPLLAAVEFTFRFLAIHPFQDGNGRMGRALFLLILLQAGDKYLEGVVPCMAMDRHIEQNRARYYSVLHQASEGRYRPDPHDYQYAGLVTFFLKIFAAALQDIRFYRERFRSLNELSEASVKVLACFKSLPERQIKVAEIEVHTKLPRRTIQFALKKLTGVGFLQRQGKAAGARYRLVF
ncbi:MAG: hypothetical protein A3G96_00300 [Gammaproteobacteria bacterium RIFCSPLOWO2_12_FULL_52_10]|nr:MAG: hypothetical protein A3G96_00300 [Gammaproteobacteria bacterium RIFCSPLOWO2_12_FULL_52_10]